jgi:hypothetical protein
MIAGTRFEFGSAEKTHEVVLVDVVLTKTQFGSGQQTNMR